jgi:8-oxo-dGTP pyrophosphatase MutT (NUDIX family)
MLGEWVAQSVQILVETRVFRLLRRLSRSPRTGRDCEFFLLDTPGWVNVVPVTEAGELLLVRQYRHGVDEFTLEIPGGMMDPEDADPATAARRELLEETGHTADRLVELGWVQPNPALQNTRCHTFLATGVRPDRAIALDGAEDLELIRIPLREAAAHVEQGKIRHALVIAALAFALGLGRDLAAPGAGGG